MRACKEKVGREPKPEKWDMPVALGIFRDGYDDLHSSSSREALGFSTSRGIPQKHGAPQKNISEAPTPPCCEGAAGAPGDCPFGYNAHCPTYYCTEEDC